MAYKENKAMILERKYSQISGEELSAFGAFPCEAENQKKEILIDGKFDSDTVYPNKSGEAINSQKKQAKDDFGPKMISNIIRFEISAPRSLAIVKPEITFHSDGLDCEIRYKRISMTWFGLNCGMDIYCAEVDLKALSEELSGSKTGLYYYKYSGLSSDGEFHLGGEEVRELREVSRYGERQLLVYDGDFHTSEKIREGIIYHIFVDRFKKSGKCALKEGAKLNSDWENGIPQFAEYPGAELKNNEFFGGDLYGIIEKLDYIKSLGTKTIYLSPVFDSPSNHKYDTSDYLTVDSMFGGDKALERLCSAAKKYGIEVILDGVFNHTGADSKYFNSYGTYNDVGACQSVKSQYFDWYMFHKYPEVYECWWGVKILPKVKSDEDSYLKFICEDVVPKWMKVGVAGWRLDVADELSEKFLQKFRIAVKRANPDGQIIGEVWEDASNKISYEKRRHYLFGNELDSVMNYPLRDAVIAYVNDGNAESLRLATEGLYRRYPKCVSDTQMNFLDTHDTERALTLFGDNSFSGLSNRDLSKRRLSHENYNKAKRKLMEAYALIVGLPGIPSVFYGDEAGLEGYRDPFCRKPYPWNNADDELVEFYSYIGGIRKNEKIFRDGLFEVLELTPECFIYKRRSMKRIENYEVIVIINNSDTTIHRVLEREVCDYSGVPLGKNVTLLPRKALYLKASNGQPSSF